MFGRSSGLLFEEKVVRPSLFCMAAACVTSQCDSTKYVPRVASQNRPGEDGDSHSQLMEVLSDATQRRAQFAAVIGNMAECAESDGLPSQSAKL